MESTLSNSFPNTHAWPQTPFELAATLQSVTYVHVLAPPVCQLLPLQPFLPFLTAKFVSASELFL